MDAADILLKERICDYTDRIPTSKWPFYSQSKLELIAAGASVATVDFQAERDILLTDLSIAAQDDAGLDLEAVVDIEYCDTVYARATDVREFTYCCDRKPIFLLGWKENKHLKFVVTLAAVAPVGGAFVLVTVSGWQGNGCCD